MHKIWIAVIITGTFSVACSSQFKSLPDATPTPVAVGQILETNTPTPYLLSTATEEVPTSTMTATQTPSPTQTNTPPPRPTLTKTPLPIPFDGTVNFSLVPHSIPFGYREPVIFTIQDEKLAVFDVTNPFNPLLLWQSDSLGENVAGIAQTNGEIFVRADDTTLIWDVENPEQPNMTAVIPFAGLIDIGTQRLYSFQSQPGGWQVTTIDIKNHQSPVVLGATILEGIDTYAWQILPVQENLFIVEDGRISIFDFSDSSAAKLATSFDVPTNINSEIQVANNLLYVMTHSGLFIFDVSNSEHPQQVTEYSNFQIDQGDIREEIAYLFWQICGWEPADDGSVSGGCGRGIDKVDLTNPVQPEHQGIIRLNEAINPDAVIPSFIDGFGIFGNLVYLADSNQTYVTDISYFQE